MASLLSSSLNILHLPEEVLENIISCLDYDTISSSRIVCRTFDRVCQQSLNQGFTRVDKYHGQIQRRIKSQLPRRESERRNHSLARHVDILAAVETRLSLLSMTYTKYIDSGLCCFIPGKVLDEISQVLRYVENNPAPPRAHELLQELRDISSMAMEHFDEKIAPGLKKQIPPLQLTLNTSLPSTSSFSPTPTTLTLISPPVASHPKVPGMRSEMSQLKHNMRTLQGSVVSVRKDLLDCHHKITEGKKKSIDAEKKMAEQSKKMAEQASVIAEQGRKMEEQERQITDLNRKVVEYNQKFVDLMSDLARVLSDNKDAKEANNSKTKKDSSKSAAEKSIESNDQRITRSKCGKNKTKSKTEVRKRSQRKRNISETSGSEVVLKRRK